MKENYGSQAQNEILDNRFFSIKAIKVYDSPDLRNHIRTIPKGE